MQCNANRSDVNRTFANLFGRIQRTGAVAAGPRRPPAARRVEGRRGAPRCRGGGPRGPPPRGVVGGWSAGRGWLARKMPRWTFRREPVLYKLYVAREMSRPDEPVESDPCFAFLRAWLPRVNAVL